MVATPTIAPDRPTMGDIVSDTSTAVPSFRSRRAWYRSTRSPRATAATISASRSRSPGGMSTSTCRPVISAAV